MILLFGCFLCVECFIFCRVFFVIFLLFCESFIVILHDFFVEGLILAQDERWRRA